MTLPVSNVANDFLLDIHERIYKIAHGHDMLCPYVINHTLFAD